MIKYSNINNAEGLSCLALAHAQLVHRSYTMCTLVYLIYTPSALRSMALGFSHNVI